MVELIQRVEPHIIKTLVEIEADNFGQAGLNEWMLVPLIRHGRVFVIRHKDQIAGSCQYIMDWEKPGKAYLIGISINHNTRSGGLGTRLLKHSLVHLAREGISEVELTVSLDNSPALLVYKKLGFKVSDFRRNEYGPGRHRLVMTGLMAGFVKE